MRRLVRIVCSVAASLGLLSACGGGGGGGGGSDAAPPAVTFSPGSFTVTTIEGTSAAGSVQATASDPSAFASLVYVYVVDPTHLLNGTIGLSPVDSRSYSASLATATNVPAGHYTGAFTVQLCKDSACATPLPGSPVKLPYDITVRALHATGTDQQRLLVGEWGVALAASPTGTVLTRSVSVSDNFGGALAWTASSDSAWLSVTASGTTGGSGSSVTLSADPTSLPAEAIGTANVTLSSSTPGVSPAVIRVALWKSASGLSAVQWVNTAYTSVVADKIRPLVYANRGDGAIDVFNVYTGQKTATIAAGTALGAMAVSPDGSRLYAIDGTAQALAVIDLATQAKLAAWPLANPVGGYSQLAVIRPNGVEVVLLGDGTAYANGRSLDATGIFNTITASLDGRRVYTQDVGLSPASVVAYDVDYSDIQGGTLVVKTLRTGWSIGASSNGRDIALSPDGTRLYTATGAPYACSVVDPATLSLLSSLPGGNAYPSNVEVTRDGRPICGNGGQFWVHSAAGALLSTYTIVGGYGDRQLVVSPDGFVVVTAGSQLTFLPIGD